MLVENLNLFLLLNYKIKIVLGAPDMPFMTFSSINNYSLLKQYKYLYLYKKDIIPNLVTTVNQYM